MIERDASRPHMPRSGVMEFQALPLLPCNGNQARSRSIDNMQATALCPPSSTQKKTVTFPHVFSILSITIISSINSVCDVLRTTRVCLLFFYFIKNHPLLYCLCDGNSGVSTSWGCSLHAYPMDARPTLSSTDAPVLERQRWPWHFLVVLSEVALVPVRPHQHDLERLSGSTHRLVGLGQLGRESSARSTPMNSAGSCLCIKPRLRTSNNCATTVVLLSNRMTKILHAAYNNKISQRNNIVWVQAGQAMK